MNILVINCGSSSLKFQLIDSETEKCIAKGLCERIGIEGSQITYTPDGGEKEQTVTPMPDHTEAIRLVLEALTNEKTGVVKSLDEIGAVGHRIVHGGEKFAASTIITDEVMKAIEECNDLAPLHNPANLIGINACKKLMPTTPMVAVFDTAFHQTMPEEAYMYGLPYEYYEKYKIRRYGFHGTSHSYVSKKAAEVLGKKYEDLKIIVCHLGNGASVSAVKNGKCVDTSMGLTPLEGLDQLESLILSSNDRIVSLEPVTKLPALRSLSLSSGTAVPSLEPLAQTNLAVLDLGLGVGQSGLYKEIDYSPLSQLPDLVCLNLTNHTRVTTKFCKQILAHSPDLRFLNIQNTPASEGSALDVEYLRAYTEADLLKRLANKLRNMFQETVEAKNVRFSVTFQDFDTYYVIADDIRLCQVLTNLVSNAVKFTAKGEITVTFQKMLQEKERMDFLIKVHDTGIGIEPAFLEKIFLPFEQESRNITKKYGGSGLGMAITDNIVRIMGGTIVINSMPGNGSDFNVFLSLPLATEEQIRQIPVEEMPEEVQESADYTFAGKQILLAEDNEINAEIAVDILEEEGASVDVAGNGKIAVEMFENSPVNHYDLILMDVQMPERNGREAASDIRRLDRADAKTVLIFALSADAYVEDKRLSRSYGMDGHFAKPVDFQKMKTEIGEIIRQKKR